MSRRKIYFTGGEDATLVFHAKHKRDGSVKMHIYPILYRTKTRKPVDYREYDKKNALATFDFQNREALESLMLFLRKMRDVMINQKGYESGYQTGLMHSLETILALEDARKAAQREKARKTVSSPAQ